MVAIYNNVAMYKNKLNKSNNEKIILSIYSCICVDVFFFLFNFVYLFHAGTSLFIRS